VEEPLEFYEPDVFPAAQPIVKALQENPVVRVSFVWQIWYQHPYLFPHSPNNRPVPLYSEFGAVYK